MHLQVSVFSFYFLGIALTFEASATFYKSTEIRDGKRLINAAFLDKVFESRKSTHCIHLCIMEYRATGRCSSVNFHRSTNICELNDLHVRDNETTIILKDDATWKWINMEFGPPAPPTLNVTEIKTNSVAITWNAQWNGGFTQTFKIEYKVSSASDFSSFANGVYDHGSGVSVDNTIDQLLPFTEYVIRITATNARPFGVNTVYTEATFTTHYAPSCSGYKNGGFTNSDDYLIDPDDNNSGLDPFLVYCDMSTSPPSAVFHHNKETQMTFKLGTQTPKLVFQVTYGPTMDQIGAVMETSTECKQHLKRDCHASFGWRTSNTYFSWWYGRSNVKLMYWVDAATVGCHCKKNNSCRSGKDCNCDANISEWLVDQGYIVSKDDLPLIKFYQGDIDGSNEITKITLGPLICTN